MNVLDKVKILLGNAIPQKLSNKCFFVGGCVRDYILGREPNDIDIVVNMRKGSRDLAFSIRDVYGDKVTKPYRLGHYPIWSITFTDDVDGMGVDGLTLEIAESMKEEFRDVNSRQRHVEFSSLQDDVNRRDFSVNSGLINVQTGEFNGISPTCLDDIRKGIIRCNVGVDKDRIFSDDPLRILRGLVFAIRFNWEIEKDTVDSMVRNGYRLKIVARERINRELEKVFDIEGGLYKLVKMLDDMDLLQYIFPHVNNQKQVFQWNIGQDGTYLPDAREIHLEGPTVFDHTLEVLKYTKSGWINGWCALFHDIGKTDYTRQQLDNGTVGFSGHDVAGSKYVRVILNKNYKLDNRTVDIVAFVCSQHMRVYQLLDAGEKPRRKFLRETDKVYRQYLYNLCKADTLGTKRTTKAIYSVLSDSFLDELERLGEYEPCVRRKNLLDGNEIMEIFGLTPGKEVGHLVSLLEDIQDEYGEKLTKEKAIELLRERK